MAISKTGIHVDESSSFNNPLIYEENGQVNSVVADNLTPATRYYTRGYVISDGTTVYSNNIRSFVTKYPNYLIFKNPNNSAITLTLKKHNSPYDITIETSIDDGETWSTWNSTGINAGSWSIPANSSLLMRGNNARIGKSGGAYWNCRVSDTCILSGELMALLDTTGQTNTIPDYCFTSFFYHNDYLDTNNFSINARSVGISGLSGCFSYCTSLTTPPDLSSLVSISDSSLNSCFGLSGLITPPDLSGLTTIPENGLSTCFQFCYSLTSAPDLSNVTYVDDFGLAGCFGYCTSLTTPPDLSGLTVINYRSLDTCLVGCTSLTTPPDLSNVTDITGEMGCWSLLKDCTSLTTPPDLSNVTDIGVRSLESCFYGCTALTTPPDLSGLTYTTEKSLSYFLAGCTSLTTPPDLSGLTTIGIQGLAGCLSGCTSLTTPPDLSNVTSLDNSGLFRTFYNFSKLTRGADISSSTSVGSYSLDRCYYGCYKINDVTAPNISDLTVNNVLDYWLDNNAGSQASGTKNVRVPSGSTIATNSVSGIPSGWNRVNY